MFGQAQGGGVVSAADQYGFIIVVPSSGRCWDVQSNKTWTRDGGGDSHAIRQMVKHAIATLQRQPGSCLCDGRLVWRHDDGAPARPLPRCLQSRLGDGGHAGRVPRYERVRQRRRVQRRVRRRLGHAHRARVGKHRSHVGPGLHGTSPARAAVSRRRRHDHQVREPHRSDQGMDECSGRRYEPDVDEYGRAAGDPPGDAAAVAEFVRPRGARRIHVDRRRSRPVRCAVQGRIRHPLPGSRQDGSHRSRDRAVWQRCRRGRWRRGRWAGLVGGGTAAAETGAAPAAAAALEMPADWRAGRAEAEAALAEAAAPAEAAAAAERWRTGTRRQSRKWWQCNGRQRQWRRGRFRVWRCQRNRRRTDQAGPEEAAAPPRWRYVGIANAAAQAGRRDWRCVDPEIQPDAAAPWRSGDRRTAPRRRRLVFAVAACCWRVRQRARSQGNSRRRG